MGCLGLGAMTARAWAGFATMSVLWGIPYLFIKVAVEAATGKRESVAIFGTDFDTPDGTGVRDYIHVSDLAAAHVAALDLLIAEPGRSHTLNAGYGRGFSVNEVLDAVDRVTNVQVVRNPQGRRAGDPAALISDNSAILKTLDWTPARDDLDLIVADALDVLLDRMAAYQPTVPIIRMSSADL